METPTVNALVFADRVFRDIESKKWIIAGVFNTIGFREFPGTYDWIEVFFQVTNLGQRVDLRFRIEAAETGEALLEFGGPIGSPSPLNVVEQKVVLRGVKFPKPGKYWLQLVSDEAILCQAPLYAKIAEAPPQTGEAPGAK
jgi:hypothetical protein